MIGFNNPGAKEVISKLQCSGHDIIVNTYRVEIEDNSLQEAISYLNVSDLPQRISKRTSKKVQPSPWNIEHAIKAGQLLIDDIAVGIPLIDAPISGGKMVDWEVIKKQLIVIC